MTVKDVGLKLSDLLEDYGKDEAKYIPDFEYVLFDFSPYTSQEIRGHIKLRLFLELIKYANTEEMSERIEELLYLVKNLDQTEDEIDYIKTAVKYFFTVEGKVNYDLLVEKSKEIIPERSDRSKSLLANFVGLPRRKSRRF